MNRCAGVAQGDSKRGVALIVVLGFLSLLMILAVGFLMLTRTERLVAASTLEAQRGRQMARTALSAAMNDYSTELWTPDRYMLPPPGMQVYPSIPPTASMDIHETLGQSNIQLLSGEALLWLPAQDQTEAVARMAADAEWILVREDPTDVTSRILGRYAYLCFDMSGGIDANLIARDADVVENGNPLDRTSVRGVGMGELTETANAEEFKRLRSGWHGFDNLAELRLLTNGKYNGGENSTAITYGGVSYNYNEENRPELDPITWSPPTNPRWRAPRLETDVKALISSEVTDLVPYSLTAYRGLWDWGSGSWNDSDVRSVDQSGEWTSTWRDALKDVDGQVRNLDDTVDALRDYVDADSIPQRLDFASPENVPMLNEVAVHFYNLQFVPPVVPGASGRLFVTVEVEFETWYPFPSEDNPGATYTIPFSPMAGGPAPQGPADSLWLRCRLASGAEVDLQQTAASVSTLAPITPTSSGNPKQVGGTLMYRLEVIPRGAGNPLTALDELAIHTIGGFAEVHNGDGIAVDRMQFSKRYRTQVAVGAQSIAASVFYEANDPRLNHANSAWVKANGNSWNAINPEASRTGYGVPGGEGKYMYCRNAPMVTPAEIGFISTGRTWETIDICTPQGAKMLSKLVTSSNIISALRSEETHHTFYTNGTINPNTSSTNVLVAAFAGLYKREVPNMGDKPGDEDGPMRREEALALANSILTETQSRRIESESRGAFMSGSDWVRVPAMQQGGSLSSLGLNKNQREALIRNTWGLFSPNNSLFTVLVIGQPIKEGAGQQGVWDADEDMITGERRAVGLIWRDPTPSGATGHHEMFVRMFKFLDE